jgi:LPS sulfotransferase NodH
VRAKRIGYAGEYFAPENAPEPAAPGYRAFVEAEIGRRSRGGVFGAKLFWDHLRRLVDGLREGMSEPFPDDRLLLESAFPPVQYLWLRRSDAVAQAVSWWKAAQLRAFYVGDPRQVTVTPSFDFDEIHGLVSELHAADEAWSQWFAEHGLEPMTITYERLAVEPVAIAAAALEHLGVSVPRRRIRVRTARQADELNAEWIDRYRHLAGERGLL